MVAFNPETEDAETVLKCGAAKETLLTGWFKANQNIPTACNFTYQEFPGHFVWDAKLKKWKPRKQGRAIGRMYFASPASGERFFLRTLLTVIKGATSYQHLRTVDEVVHSTY